MRKKLTLAAALLVGATSLTACDFNKATQPWNDAGISRKDDSKAETYSMPDGFNNFAEKCDRHGNRVVTLYHGDSGYGSIAIVRDPSCSGG